MKKLLLVVLLLLAASSPAWGVTDSTIIYPDGDFSRAEWDWDSLLTATCGTTGLWSRIKETSGNKDTNYVVLDNCVLGCLDGAGCGLYTSGVKEYQFTMTDPSFDGRTADSIAVYVQAYIDAVEAGDSLTVGFTMLSNCAPGGPFTGRLGKFSFNNAAWKLQRFSTTNSGATYCFTDSRLDSLQIYLDGAMNLLNEDRIKVSQVYCVVYYTSYASSEAAMQPPATACEFTLIPNDTGTIAMDVDFRPTITSRADAYKYIDDSLACAPARFPSGDSSIAFRNNTFRTVKFGVTNPGSECSGQQIDAITVRFCARAIDGADGGTGIGPCSLRVGISVNPKDSLPMQRMIINSSGEVDRFVTFPGQINDAIRGDRWSRDSLNNLQIFFSATGDTGVSDTLEIGCVKVLVHCSVIDTTVPDSTDEDIERVISGAWTNEPQQRSGGGFWQSLDTLNANAYNTLWAFVSDNTQRKNWAARASNDSGATWTFFSGPVTPGEDSFFIQGRNPRDTLATSVGGPCVFSRWRNRNDDSIYIIAGRSDVAPANPTHRIWASIGTNTDTAKFIENGDLGGAGQLDDTLSAGTANTLRNNQRVDGYALDDTIWVVGILDSNNNATAANVNGWVRSTDKGETWVSGKTNRMDSIGNNRITAGPTNLEAVIVPWRTFGNSTAGPYPAVFLQTVTNAACGKVMFYQWNPKAASLDTVWGTNGNTSNIKPTLVCSLNVGCTAITGCATGQGSDLRGTVVWKDSTNMTAHCMWVAGGKIFHARVTYNGSTITTDTNLIWEENNCENTQFDMCSWDTVVYAFWRHNDSLSAAAGSVVAGTSKIWFSIWDGSKWRAPRPLTMSKTIETSTRRNLIRVSVPRIVNKKSPFIPVLMTGNPATNLTTPTRLYFSKILKRAVAAAGGTQMPPRRRRIILEKNHPYGRTDEKDSTWTLPVIGRVGNTEDR